MKKILVLIVILIGADNVYAEFGVKDILNCFGLTKFADTNSICEAVGSFEKIYNGNFQLGGCSISYGGEANADCFIEGLSSLCKSTIDSEIISPAMLAVSSVSEFEFLKGDAFKKSACAERFDTSGEEFPSGMTESSLYEKSDMSSTLNLGMFSSKVEDLRDCMKVSGEKCLEDDYGKLPKDTIATEKEILKSAEAIAVADETISSRVLTLQAEVSKKVKDCNRSKDCIDEVLNNEYSPKALLQKEIARIEMASSVELITMNKASRGDTYYVHKSSKDIETLPAEDRVDYGDGVSRQNSADVLINALFKELVDLKKESISASYNSIDITTASYQSQEGIESIQRGLEGMQEKESE